MLKDFNLFSKHYNDFKVCSRKEGQESTSKIISLDLSSIPYALFTKNYSEMSKDESTQLSEYIANIMYLLDGRDICDKNGIAYIAELFAFKCSGIKIGTEVHDSIKEIEAIIPNNPLVGLAYDMSGCNDSNTI